jgi:CubicO group peptidase (beta-lactamase class C family)
MNKTTKRHAVLATAAILWLSRTAFADRVDDYIELQMKRRHIPGISLAAVKDGKIIKEGGYGFANIEANARATPKTVYKIASISKQFLAAGIMLLVQDGKIKLDDKLSKYLDGTPETWKDITVRQVLAHTSGISQDPPGFDPYKVKPDAEVIGSAYSLPLEFPPGEKWDYSNVGYDVIGEIIHKVTGESYSAFLAERVFVPVGMTATRTITTTEIVPLRACGYTWRNDKLQNAENWISLCASGAFLSTVEDLAKWDSVLYSDSILNSLSKQQMWTPVMLKGGVEQPYGFGWFIDDWQGHKRIYHGGNLPGFVSHFDRFVDDKLTIIVLINTDNADPGKIALNVAGVFVPELAPPVLKPILTTEPEITEKGKAMITAFERGSVDLSLFASETASHMTEEMRTRMTESLRHFGKIQSIDLVEFKIRNSNRLCHYRVSFQNDSILFTVSFDKSNKIAGFGFEEDY